MFEQFTKVPVTTRPSSYLRAQGWAQLAEVTYGLYFNLPEGEPCRRVVDAYVFLKDVEGNVYVVSPRKGHTVHDLAAAYSARGYTDGEASLMG